MFVLPAERSSILKFHSLLCTPSSHEAVTGVVGRAELLSSAMFLSAILLYIGGQDGLCKHRRTVDFLNVLTVGLLILIGTFSKEQCITVFGVFFTYELYTVYQKILSNGIGSSQSGFKKGSCQKSRTLVDMIPCTCQQLQFKLSLPVWISYASICRILILLLFVFAIMVARIRIMGGQLPILLSLITSSTCISVSSPSHSSLLDSCNLGLLIFPSNLCADWTLGSLRLIDGWTDARNILTVTAFGFLFVLVLTSLSWKTSLHQSQTIFMALNLMIFPFIPASNLFFPVGFVVAERVLYTPIGLKSARTKTVTHSKSVELKKLLSCKHGFYPRKYARILMGLVIIGFVFKTIQRNTDWSNEYNLFTSALKVNPNNAKMWNNVGHSLEAEGKFAEALGYFRKAVDVQPNDMGARINVGRTYVNLGMPDKAEEAYYGALEYFPKPKKGQTYYARVSPKDLMVFINLANLYINKSPPRLEDAANLLRRAISLRSDFVDAYQNYGSVLIKLGKYNEAEKAYRNALMYQPKNPDLNYNLGVVLLESREKAEGLSYLNTA
ncbi:unnamed protein product [Heterobilharzia americana]|nr:unnamed protein product [Heterobilharzia americana]